ncbi:DUF6475 domain-containing protein [Pseudoxanthomonas winnipegensis]|uniref:DUF6475 domain-containing protein n=1 Tax=Pseudoxanthomonas winnipegensis TaxID=2480810 RepID=UPI00197FC2B6|nr:DUF6475 domain-containing protein [Pseudoxanthomonas winnipegensis]
MKVADRPQFAELITQVLSFYDKPVTTFGLAVWWEACKPFSLQEVQRALSRHATNPERGQFAPKPADLVRELQGTAGDRAARAWSLVYDACGRVGAYTDVVFDDPIIHAVIEDLGGWPATCRTEADKLSYTQHRFIIAYTGYVNRGDLSEYPRRLAGDRSPDAAYTQRGLPAPAPVMVGDTAAARLVMENGTAAPRYALTRLEASPGAAAVVLDPPAGARAHMPSWSDVLQQLSTAGSEDAT